jgi:hypothetical protein
MNFTICVPTVFQFNCLNCYRTSEDADIQQSFLFVHQTSWQRNLLHKYGQEICLMDGTYNTTTYDLPLYFVCVNTNVGFSVVASFLLGKETKKNIKEALGHIRSWNDDWQPAHFMTDFDFREIGAIEEVFPGIHQILLVTHP